MMKARLLIHMAGEPGYAPGDLAEGFEAARYAEQVVKEETASRSPAIEKAVRPKKSAKAAE